jgi:hypothetical protein
MVTVSLGLKIQISALAYCCSVVEADALEEVRDCITRSRRLMSLGLHISSNPKSLESCVSYTQKYKSSKVGAVNHKG